MEASMKSVISLVIFLCLVISMCFIADTVYAGSIKEFRIFASGQMTDSGASDCESSNDGCTVTNEGIARGTHIGKGTFAQTVTIFWKSGWQAGSDGFCAPAHGYIVITAADKSTMTAERAGTVCKVRDNVAFNATYFITGGTKRFANASGTGISACSVDKDGKVLGFANGSLIK